MDISTRTVVLSRSKVAELGTTKDYLAAMRTAFADLANQRYVVPNVGNIPADDGAFHIKAGWRQGSSIWVRDWDWRSIAWRAELPVGLN